MDIRIVPDGEEDGRERVGDVERHNSSVSLILCGVVDRTVCLVDTVHSHRIHDLSLFLDVQVVSELEVVGRVERDGGLRPVLHVHHPQTIRRRVHIAVFPHISPHRHRHIRSLVEGGCDLLSVFLQDQDAGDGNTGRHPCHARRNQILAFVHDDRTIGPRVLCVEDLLRKSTVSSVDKSKLPFKHLVVCESRTSFGVRLVERDRPSDVSNLRKRFRKSSFADRDAVTGETDGGSSCDERHSLTRLFHTTTLWSRVRHHKSIVSLDFDISPLGWTAMKETHFLQTVTDFLGLFVDLHHGKSVQ